jgi:hypothetical protein
VPTLRNVLFAATVVGLTFSTSEAEARFGKSSSDSSDSPKENKVHEASAVGKEPPSSLNDDDEEETYSPPPQTSSDVDIVTPPVQTYYVASGSSAEAVNTSSSVPQVSATPEKLNSNIRLGADGAAMGGGSALHLFLAFEGDRMGLDLRGTGLTLPTDDGTSGTDSITLGSVHFTYALVARDNLRVRLEGGLSGARAPDLSVTGPSIALSLEGCLTQRVDLELRAQATPFPFQQLDAQAGVALRFQALVLRTGWRGLYLNDNGLVDNVEHADAFGGPFLGLGLTF